MKKMSTVVLVVLVLAFSHASYADEPAQRPFDDLLGFKDSLAESGIDVGFGITNIYQQNVRGGLSKHNRRGRITGSYDVEVSAELEKLLGWESGNLYIHLEGGWPDAEGIDGPSVGSAFGVNADAIGNRAMDVKQLFYEGPVFSEDLNLMIGKIDFTGVFDCSEYADDECSQFLNAAFVDDPTIPFPAYSLGIVLTYSPADYWYLSGGIADAQADGRETGFRTAFHKEDYFLYILEAGLSQKINIGAEPLDGTYRAGIWYDPQPKANSDASKSRRDDTGLYLSCDQLMLKENADEQDNQGLGVFFRYGYADGRRNDITSFWSIGLQYRGLFEGRDEDVLGAGFAKGIFSDSADTTYTDDYENAFEIYYNLQISDWLNLSPSVQYIANPGGNQAVSDAVVLGLRTRMNF